MNKNSLNKFATGLLSILTLFIFYVKSHVDIFHATGEKITIFRNIVTTFCSLSLGGDVKVFFALNISHLLMNYQHALNEKCLHRDVLKL